MLVVTHLLCLGPVLRQLQILRLGRRELRLRSRSPAHSNISGPYCVRDPAHLQALTSNIEHHAHGYSSHFSPLDVTF